MKKKDILVIIPAYNEEANIASAIREIRKALPDSDILVINDASTDKTSSVAKKEKVVVIDMPFNVGVGGAMQTGFLCARELGYKIAVQIDADRQHNPEELPAMLNALNETKDDKRADMVIASRFLAPEGFKTSFLRRVGIRYFSLLIYLFTGKKITDPTSGFRMIDRRLIDIFSEHYAEDYPEPEAVVFALKKGLNVREIPTCMRPRKKGSSTITPLKAIYYMIKVSIAILILALTRSKQ